MTYTAWARLPPGRWFELGTKASQDEAWRLALWWKPPVGQKVDERTVLPDGKHPSTK